MVAVYGLAKFSIEASSGLLNKVLGIGFSLRVAPRTDTAVPAPDTGHRRGVGPAPMLSTAVLHNLLTTTKFSNTVLEYSADRNG